MSTSTIAGVSSAVCATAEFKSKTIPWIETLHTTKAQNILKMMYESLEGNEKQFAEKHLQYLLHPLVGYSHISVDCLSAENVINDSYTLNSSISPYVISEKYVNHDCIYSFSPVENPQMETTYIGLTQNVANRLTYHIQIIRNPDKHMGSLGPYVYELGLDKINFNVILSYPKFKTLWLEENNSITPEFLYILKAFSEYRLGISEQAMFNYFNPGLNVDKTTMFTFYNWIKGYSDTNDTTKFIGSPESLDLIKVNHSGFNFDLHHALSHHRNVISVDQEWLEWFVGFCDQRPVHGNYFRNKAFFINSQNEHFLDYIKQCLQLNAPVKSRGISKSALGIYNSKDYEVLAAIFHKNLVSVEAIQKFHEFMVPDFKVLDYTALDSVTVNKVSIDNAWLSGFIDGAATFSYQKADYFVPIIEVAVRDPAIFAAIISLFPVCTKLHKTKRIVFKGRPAVNGILAYLNKYPLKLNKVMQDWLIECMELHGQSTRMSPSQKEALMLKINSRPNKYISKVNMKGQTVLILSL